MTCFRSFGLRVLVKAKACAFFDRYDNDKYKFKIFHNLQLNAYVYTDNKAQVCLAVAGLVRM